MQASNNTRPKCPNCGDSADVQHYNPNDNDPNNVLRARYYDDDTYGGASLRAQAYDYAKRCNNDYEDYRSKGRDKTRGHVGKNTHYCFFTADNNNTYVCRAKHWSN